MIIEYDKQWICYLLNLQIKFGTQQHELKAIIDTGATNTVIALNTITPKTIFLEIVKKLDDYAQRENIKRIIIRGSNKNLDVTETYAYNAYFDNVIIGGYQMKKFHARIMVNGEKDICVIENNFLNICNYYTTLQLFEK